MFSNYQKVFRKRPFFSRMTLTVILLLSVMLFGCAAPAATTTPATTAAAPANPEMILASTTSTRDTGLLDVLLPMFEKKSGYKVKLVAVGTGAAMTMGERGEADVLLVHAPESEVKFMAANHGVTRKLVMHNDFVIIGPSADPAGIKGMKLAVDAMKKIASSKSVFVSRGDNSGTNQLELKIWKLASIDPSKESWYQQSGQGMGATLGIANQKMAYTITDRGTFLAQQKNLELPILVEGDGVLLNIYHVIDINPNKSDKINVAGGKAFVEFMVSPEVQAVIKTFGVDKYGSPLFFPDAGKTEAELGSV